MASAAVASMNGLDAGDLVPVQKGRQDSHGAGGSANLVGHPHGASGFDRPPNSFGRPVRGRTRTKLQPSGEVAGLVLRGAPLPLRPTSSRRAAG